MNETPVPDHVPMDKLGDLASVKVPNSLLGQPPQRLGQNRLPE
jgi:hypothetical protein